MTKKNNLLKSAVDKFINEALPVLQDQDNETRELRQHVLELLEFLVKLTQNPREMHRWELAEVEDELVRLTNRIMGTGSSGLTEAVNMEHKMVKESMPLMLDVGEEAEKQKLVRDVMESLASAEETRDQLVLAMKEENDPLEQEIYKKALAIFTKTIADQYDILKTLARGNPKLRGGMKKAD